MLNVDADILLHDNHAVGYFTSVLKAGVTATREQLHLEEYKKLHQCGDIPVDIEIPMRTQVYPYIQLAYKNKSFYPSSLDTERHFLKLSDEEISDGKYHIYIFEGTYQLNLYANTILEREKISDTLIGALGIDDRYKKRLINNPFISIAPNMKTLASNTYNESWGTPTDKNAITAFRQFTFDVKGEFAYQYSKVAHYIESIYIDGKIVDNF